MIAYLLDGNGARKLRYASHAHLLRLLDDRRMDMVVWWPPSSTNTRTGRLLLLLLFLDSGEAVVDPQPQPQPGPTRGTTCCVWFSSASPKGALLVHRLENAHRAPEQGTLDEVRQWAHEHDAKASAYRPPREEWLAPTPNGGSKRTHVDIASWCDADLDAFTFYAASRQVTLASHLKKQKT